MRKSEAETERLGADGYKQRDGRQGMGCAVQSIRQVKISCFIVNDAIHWGY